MIVASGRVTAFAWPRQGLMRPTADDRARPRSCGDPAKPSRWQAWFNVRIAYGADLTPRTGLQNITFPSHADNFRHALLFHRGTGANDLTAAKASSDGCRPGGQGSAMRGHPLRRRTEIEWLTRAGRFDVSGIGNIATPCSVGAKWRFHLADFACDKKRRFSEQTAVSRPVKCQSALDWTCRFVALRAIAAEDGGAIV
jgi:hypothetical protein